MPNDNDAIKTEYRFRELDQALRTLSEVIKAQDVVIKEQGKIINHRETIISLHENRIKALEESHRNLKGGINRGLWILGGGFITAFVMWITNGGMHGGN